MANKERRLRGHKANNWKKCEISLHFLLLRFNIYGIENADHCPN